MPLLDLWEQTQPSLKEKIGASAYETWFSSIRAREKDPGTLIIETPDEFFNNWIVDNYLSIMEEALAEITSQKIRLELIVNPSIFKTSPLKKSISPAPEKEGGAVGTVTLNSRFSFDNFVIGPSNRFAFAACQAVAESPAKAYNPLFIYGAVGLGKTHLLQGIAQQIKKNHPQLKYCYLSSEHFTNELIDSIRHRSTAQFRKKYRNIDVLLIDDIHFIAGKEATQEEFFHTFNALHNDHKQIIISSDRQPKEIANLEDRLRSRFAWGLITDIQPPDFETRVAILHKKLEREPVDVPDDVINFIASQITTNIRELEGGLIRVVAYSLLEEKPISLNVAQTVLRAFVQETLRTITIEKIQKTVADFYKIPFADLKTKRRSQHFVLPRQVAMYLSRQLTTLSFPEIGKAFGGKDHTTVLHSCKKIEKDLTANLDLRDTLERLTTTIKQ